MSPRNSFDRPASDVYELLKQRILRGEFSVGERLPSLRSLAGQYSVSVTGIHHAIVRLEREGWVQVKHGSGVFAIDLASRPKRVLLLNPVEGDHWADFTRAFTQEFASNPRVHLLVEAPSPSPNAVNESLRAKVRDMIREGLDLIVFNGINDLGMEFLHEHIGQVPLICFLLDEVVRDHSCARVISDVHHGGYAGMRHLMEAGCTRVVLTQHTDPPPPPLRDFLAGARAAAAESLAGVTVIPFQASTYDDVNEVLARFRVLFEREKPDGVFTHADWLGSRILTDLQRRGTRVPDDVKVLGYFDTPWTMMTDPPMSSITTDPVAMVRAIRQLFDTKNFSERIIIKPRLVIRESTHADKRFVQKESREL